MKSAVTFLVMALLCVRAEAAEVTVEVTNPIAMDRTSETAAVNWNVLREKLPDLSPDNVRVLDSAGAAVLSQVIDNDGDGTSDELLFQVSLAGNETKTWKVAADAGRPPPNPEARVHARYVPERKDDFAWENDLVAFRAYGPALEKGDENSGYDCFMKRVKYPVVDGWYKGESLGKSYHLDYGEGYDGYKVGASLGAGGSAVWSDDRINLLEVYHQWKQFSAGPIRASFTLSYGPWEIGGRSITETRRITLDLGQRVFKVEEQFFADGKPARLDVAVGVATHEGAAAPVADREQGWLYAWEKIDGNGLGTGVIVPADIIKDYRVIDSKEKYAGNAFFVVDPGDDGSFTYYAGYGWEKAGEITTPELWQNYLEGLIERDRSPVQITVK